MNARRPLGSSGVALLVCAGLAVGCGNGSKHAAPEQSTRATAPARVPVVASAPRTAAAPRNVVMVVFEEFSLVQLLDAANRIDPALYPNFARFADGATFFRNFTAIGDQSSPVTSALISSERYQLGVPGVARLHRDTIFSLLGAHGFGIDASEDVSAFCPRRLCPRAHQSSTGPAVVRLLDAGHRLDTFRRWVASIHRTRRRMLFYAHSALPHTPLEYLPDGRLYREPASQPPLYLANEASVHDPWLVDQSWQRALLQIGAVDRMLGELVARLKATGLYDSSLVLVTADNGEAYGLPGHNRHLADPATATAIASTPLLVKLPGQQAGQIVDRHLDTYDVLPTIARLIRVRIPWPVLGRPAGGRRDGIDQNVTVVRRRGPPIRLALANFERRRSALVRRKLTRFSHGLLRIGPVGELVGQPVASLRVVRSTALHARIDLPGRYRSVDLEARTVPVLVTGRLSGRAARLGLPLAVSVNGRVAATGFDSGVPGLPGPRFSVLLPERSLTAGANTVRVYAIRTPGGRPELVAPTG